MVVLFLLHIRIGGADLNFSVGPCSGLLVFAVFPAYMFIVAITVVFLWVKLLLQIWALCSDAIRAFMRRLFSASIAYQLGAMLGGGLAPVIATLILTTTGGTIWISVYAALACLVSWFCFQRLRGIQAQAPSLIAGGCYDGPGVK